MPFGGGGVKDGGGVSIVCTIVWRRRRRRKAVGHAGDKKSLAISVAESQGPGMPPIIIPGY